MSTLDKKYIIKLDLEKETYNKDMEFSISDLETSDFWIDVKKSRKAIDFTNYHVVLYITKPNGNIRTIDAVFDEEKEMHYCNLTGETKNLLGDYAVQVIVNNFDEEERLVVPSKIKYRVVNDILNDTYENIEEVEDTFKENYDALLYDVESVKAKNATQDERLNEIEWLNTVQDDRLLGVENYNYMQDERFANIERLNEEQTSAINNINLVNDEQDAQIQGLGEELSELTSQFISNAEDVKNAITEIHDELDEKDLILEDLTNISTQNTSDINRLEKECTDRFSEVKQEYTDRFSEIEQEYTNKFSEIEQEYAEKFSEIEKYEKTTDSRLASIESRNTNQDSRLKSLESKQTSLSNVVDTIKVVNSNQTIDINNLKNKMTTLEQNSAELDKSLRGAMDSLEKNVDEKIASTDESMRQLMAKDKIQDLDIKMLYAEIKDPRIEIDGEGYTEELYHSRDGSGVITQLDGRTLVNANKDVDKELILNGEIDIQGENSVTTDQGKDGGLVDVYLEGNTMVNVSSTKEETGISEQRTVENTVSENTEYDGVYRPELYGNTMVNLNKDSDKELTLMSEINEQGQDVDLTNGADGGLVDVYLEGNTMVNVCDQQDSVPLIMSYTSTEGNHVAFQGDYDGKAKPYIYGNTLVNLMTNYKEESDIQYYYPITNPNVANVSMLKPNTEYTIIYKAKYKQEGDTGRLVICTTENGSEDIMTSSDLTASYQTYVFKFTTLSTVDYFTLRSNAHYFCIKEVILLEGDYTNKPIPNYFEGLQSSFEEQVVPTSIMNMEGEFIAEQDRVNKPPQTLTTNLKADTVYTRVYHVSELVEGDIIKKPTMYDYVWGETNAQYSITLSKGWNVKVFTNEYEGTTYDLIVDQQWRSKNTNADRKLVIDKFYIIEGDWTSYDFSDYNQDNGGKYKVDYVSVGKNKFNPQWILDSGIATLNADGSFTLNGTLEQNHIGKIHLKAGTYTTSASGIHQAFHVFWNGNDNFFHNEALGYTHTFTEDVELTYYIAQGTFDNVNVKWQLEEGSVATEFEPFKQTTKTLYLNSPLLEGDSIEVSGDNIVHVHRYGKVVLDGSENWEIASTSDGNYRFEINMPNAKIVGTDEVTCICDNYPCTTPVNAWFGTQEGFTANASKHVLGYFSPNYNDGTDTSLSNFKAQLLSKPATVIYPLETSTYEVISSDDNLYIDSYVSGHLDFDSAVPIDKVEFKYNIIILKYLHDNVKYNVQFEADNEGITHVILGGQYVLVNKSVVKGTNKFECTCPTNNNKLLAFIGIGCNISNIVVTEATDQDFGYFKGMKSVGECEELEVISSSGDYSQIQTQQLTHEPLRAVGDVKDRYVLIDGEWYIERNCGEIVLDGSENWYLYPNLTVAPYYFYKISDYPYGAMPGGTSDTFKSDLLINKSEYNEKEYGIWCDNNVFITSNIDNLESFKQWLSKNPITVVYQLATPTYEPIDYNPLSVYKDMAHITTNSTIPCNMTIKNHGFNTLLKPNTTYTIASNQGVQTFQTGAILDDSLRLYGEGTMKDVTVLEGAITDTDLIPAHFSGIESAFEQEYDEEVGKYKVEVKTTGKNLFDGIYRENSWIAFDTGNIGNAQGHRATVNYIRVKPNTTYRTSSENYIGVVLYFYDGNKNMIRYVDTSIGYENRIVTDSNTHYIRWYGPNSTFNNITYLQVEEGDTATAYEPHKSSTISFYLDEPLRGIGDVRDRVFVENGEVKVERKVGSMVLDGSEDWKGQYSFANAGRWAVTLPDMVQNSIIICDNFINENNNATGKEGIFATDKLLLTLSNLKDNPKQWLSKNPVKVVYQLAEPTVEEIDNVSLSVNGFADGHIFFDTRIPLSKVEFKPFEEELKYLYPSRVYNVQFVADQIGLVDITLGGARLSNQVVSIGLNKFRITTPTTLVDNKLIINGREVNISEVVVCDSINNYGYFEGMKSVGEGGSLEIKSCNKNIIDDNLENWELLTKTPTYTFSNEGKTLSVTYTDGWNHGIILTTRLKKGTYYCGLSKTGNVDIYYNDGTAYDINISNKTFTISNDTVVSFKLKNTNSVGGTYTVSDVYINEETNLGYIPHQFNSQIMTHEPLRAIGNIRDKYVLQDGNWYIERNCGEVVIGGDEVEFYYYVNQTNPIENATSFFVKSSKALNRVVNGAPQPVVCDKFRSDNTQNYLEGTENNIFGWTDGSADFVGSLGVKFNSPEEIKEYFENNPITVIYQLATPTYEKLDYNPFSVYKDMAHISTNSTIPANLKVKNHGFNCMLKPSTDYTIVSNNGVNYMTTPAELNETSLRFFGEGVMKDLMVLEGKITVSDMIPNTFFKGMLSAFEQEYDEEKGQYKVVASTNNGLHTWETCVYINEPLRSCGDVADKLYSDGYSIMVERNCGERDYQEGDFELYQTDYVKTIYPLDEPTYEAVNYIDTKLSIGVFENAILSIHSALPTTYKVKYPVQETLMATAVNGVIDITDEQDSMIIDLAVQVAIMEMCLM